MVLTTQHAFKHCKTVLLPPAVPTRAAAAVSWKHSHSQPENRFNMRLKRIFYVGNSLPFVLHSFVHVPLFKPLEIAWTSCVHCFAVVIVGGFCQFYNEFFRSSVYHHLFWFVAFSLWCIWMTTMPDCHRLCFRHMHRCYVFAVAFCFVLFWFCIDLLCTQHETIKPHNTQLIRLNKCPNQ